MTKLSRKRVLLLAAPLIVANATTPLMGLVDTAALGHGGNAVDLAAVSLGVLIFNFLYWGFGFLKMATTGFVAQAAGAGDEEELAVSVLRPVLLGLCIGLLLLLLQRPIEDLAFSLLSGAADAESAAATYLRARIWGAPAALASLGGVGLLIGLGQTRKLLAIQLLVNGLNMALDWTFVIEFGWGVRGVAIGTAIAEWTGAVVTLAIAWQTLRARNARISLSLFLEAKGLAATLRANLDIMIRTFAMICGFAFFTDQGAKMGTTTLAANYLLLQLISFSAFFLDGYAHVAESLVGAAKGAKDKLALSWAISVTAQVAFFTAIFLAALVFFAGPAILRVLTDISEIVALAEFYLPYAALYVACSVAAFQLDGIFIGATQTRSMLVASLLSVACFIAIAIPSVAAAGNEGLWWAFVAYVCARGISLAAFLPKVYRIEK